MEKSNTRLFPIGEVARMFHLSVGTLRHDEKRDFWNRSTLMKIRDIAITVPGSLSV